MLTLDCLKYPNPTDKDLPTIMQLLRTQSIPRAECRRKLGQRSVILNAASLCTQPARGRGVCHGDGGSPLVDDQGILQALVSWSDGCGRDVTDVYTRIHPHLPFIRTIAGNSRNF